MKKLQLVIWLEEEIEDEFNFLYEIGDRAITSESVLMEFQVEEVEEV